MVGKSVLHYKIIEEIGRGGMGVVYKAQDTKLDRLVALKFLPQHLATQKKDKTRFLQEAKAAAALNHSNVCTIYEIRDQNDPPFIVMECVNGENVRDIVAEKGALPVTDVVAYAIQIADALHEAHGKGIIHRDIKSDNIMVNEKNQIKVMDFGLAKLKGALRLTKSASTVGTLAYMSPEHLQGAESDARSDIFSFGVVLYEMLAGKLPFEGEYESAIMYSILNEDPIAIEKLRSDLPRGLSHILELSLEKDPEDRYQSMSEILRELRRLKKHSSRVSRQDIPLSKSAASLPETYASLPAQASSPVEPVAEASAPGRASGPKISKKGPRSNVLLSSVLGVLLVLAIAFMAYQFFGGSSPTPPTQVRFSQITVAPERENFPDISPDGKYIAFTRAMGGQSDIFLQRTSGGNALNLTPSSPEYDSQPSFSPDGEAIAFRSERDGGGIFVMGATGESVRRITDFGYNPVWSPDGKMLLFATEEVVNPYGRGTVSSLWTVDLQTGDTRKIPSGDAVQPAFSPHGYRIAYWSLRGLSGQRDIFTIPAEGGDPVDVTNEASVDWNPVWSPDGKFLYFASSRGGSMNIWRLPIDEKTGKVLGKPQPITAPARDVAHLRISGDGTKIVYTSVQWRSNIFKTQFDSKRSAVVGKPVPVTRGSNKFDQVAVSPDGNQLVFQNAGPQEDIFVSDSAGKNIRQLTNDSFKDRGPTWSPDGREIIFYSDRGGSYECWTIKPDGSDLTQVTHTPSEVKLFYWPRLFPDGKHFLGVGSDGTYILEYPPKDGWNPEILPSLDGDKRLFIAFSISADGKWLAGFTQPRNEGFQRNVVVYSRQSQEYQTLTEDGTMPVWLNDGVRLVYQGDDGLWLINRRTLKTKLLSSNGANLFFGPISPTLNNRRFYFSGNEVESDIWTAELAQQEL